MRNEERRKEKRERGMNETTTVESNKDKKKKKKKDKEIGAKNESASESEVEKPKKTRQTKKKHDKDDDSVVSEESVDQAKNKNKKKRDKSKKSNNLTSDSENVKYDVESVKTKDSGPVLGQRKQEKGVQLAKKMDPTQWTREQLMEKFDRFGIMEVNKEKGSAIVRVEGRKILGEETRVLLEIFRRYTEIQTVTIKKCFLTDEVFANLYTNGLTHLRHLKHLNLQYNVLTRLTTQLIVSAFIRIEKKLLTLDIRENVMNEEDGKILIETFPSILSLNGIPVQDIKEDGSENYSIVLPDTRMRISEVAIVCYLLERYKHIHGIDLSMNFIDSDCLLYISNHIEPLRHVFDIKLRLNPLTNNGDDLSGVKEYTAMVQRNKFICNTDFTGGNLPLNYEESIERSMMVNRCLRGTKTGNLFQNYMNKLILEKEKPIRIPRYEQKKMSLIQDSRFLLSDNNVAKGKTMYVDEVTDEIILPKGMCHAKGLEHHSRSHNSKGEEHHQQAYEDEEDDEYT